MDANLMMELQLLRRQANREYLIRRHEAITAAERFVKEAGREVTLAEVCSQVGLSHEVLAGIWRKSHLVKPSGFTNKTRYFIETDADGNPLGGTEIRVKTSTLRTYKWYED